MSVQRSGAQCLSNSTFDWTFNSADQSPCDVAAGLQGICTTGAPVVVPPLQSGQTYGGPAELLTTPCICSSVYYSMLSACAFCQGRQWLNWSTYSVYCTTLYVQIFPSSLPTNLRVPAWAYLNVAIRDRFDPTVAQDASASNLPDSTAFPTPTSASLSVSSTQSFISTAPTSTNAIATQTPSISLLPSKSKVNVGAIAGAAVGGIIVLLSFAIGISVILVVKRRHIRRQRAAVASEFVASNFAHGGRDGHKPPPPSRLPTSISTRQISADPAKVR